MALTGAGSRLATPFGRVSPHFLCDGRQRTRPPHKAAHCGDGADARICSADTSLHAHGRRICSALHVVPSARTNARSGTLFCIQACIYRPRPHALFYGSLYMAHRARGSRRIQLSRFGPELPDDAFRHCTRFRRVFTNPGKIVRSAPHIHQSDITSHSGEHSSLDLPPYLTRLQG